MTVTNLLPRLLLCGFMLPIAVWASSPLVSAQERVLQKRTGQVLGPYEYEVKPEGEAFERLNPRLAPRPGELLLRRGDKLAICGDSITEQKMYSRIIETYLTACLPELEVTVRQYGWSGEKTDGFLRRMEQDCLTFEPTIATLSYGMNDARYRPFDVTNGHWYEDHYSAIVQKFKSAGVRVVVGSPGASGRLATWVKSRSGTLEEHNQNLCALRDIAIGLAEREHVAFADVFWPMYQAQVIGDQRYSTAEEKYEIAGKDGIHPGWAGHVIMAYSYLRALGLDGDLGTIRFDYATQMATATDGHRVVSVADANVTIESSKYPFCAEGPTDKDSSIRSGMELVPFHQDLNRLTLVVTGLQSEHAKVTWGEWEHAFTSAQLAEGVNLAEHFVRNPFSQAFKRVDDAVAAKQAYETTQVKKIFHGPDARRDFAKVVQETEAERRPLADAIHNAVQPVTHILRIQPIE